MAMNRERGQVIGLAVIVGLGVFLVLWLLGLRPLAARRAVVEAAIAKESGIRSAQQKLLDRDAAVVQDYTVTRESLQSTVAAAIPPAANAMAWVTAVVRRAGDEVGLAEQDRQISELGTSERVQPSRGTSSKDLAVPVLERYAVRLDVLAGYHQFGRFLASMERELPYMRVRSLTMLRASDAEGMLRVTLECEFSRFSAEGFAPESRPDAEIPAVPAKGKK